MENAIKVTNIKPNFFTKSGMPKKEYMKTVIDVLNDLGIDLKSLNRYERAYMVNLCNAVLKAIRDSCREHHINWLDVKIPGEKYVYHGFSRKQELIEASKQRVKDRATQHKIIYNKVKQIIDEQLMLDFGDNS